MISALRWAAMRAILMFHNCEGQGHKTVSTDHNLWSERRAEADSNRCPSAYQPNALPLGQTGSRKRGRGWSVFCAAFLVSELQLMVKITPTWFSDWGIYRVSRTVVNFQYMYNTTYVNVPKFAKKINSCTAAGLAYGRSRPVSQLK